MNLKESIRRILREESNLSFRRRVKFGEIDKSVKRRMVSNFRKDGNIEKSIDTTVAGVVSDVIGLGFVEDEIQFHKIWHELTSFIRQKYGDDLRQYFEKRQKEVDQENNKMGYSYIFVKHDKPYHQQWSGFAKAFNSFDDMITKYGHWIDVDWDEVKQKLDNIKDFPESTFTGRHNSRPLRISSIGDEGNTWGYNFSVIKSIPEENIGKQEQNEGEISERCWKGYTKKGMKTMFGKRYPNCVKKTNR